MAVTIKITPINRSIELMMQRHLSPEARSARLAVYAKERLAEAQATNRQALGRVPPHDTYVDGRTGAQVESVKPDGVIVFDFELLDDLFGWIDLQLITHAPVLTGKFRRSFVFFADGVEVDPDGDIPPAREYVYLNTQPYARKIERGLSKQAPDGVFQAVATLARKRFSNLAAIDFEYRAVLNGAVADWAGKRRPSKTGKSRRSRERALEKDTRQPAIIINVG